MAPVCSGYNEILRSPGKVLTLSQNKYVITILNKADNCVVSFFANSYKNAG